jgi:phytanoyl-CoA hydroxylase
MKANWKDQSAELLTQFDQDGFALIRGFLSMDEISEVRANLHEFIKTTVPTLPANHVFYEDKSKPETLKQLQGLHRHAPFFEALTVGSQFEELASMLMREQAIAQNLQYFNKPPGLGKPTPAHQDGYYFMLKPCAAVTMWMALEKVDQENGCVRYVPGSHKRGMRDHQRTSTLGFSQGIADWSDEDEAAALPFPAEPGDLLVHSAMTIHRADGNNSPDRSRPAMGFVYFAESAKTDEQAKAAYQKHLTREMEQSGQI